MIRLECIEWRGWVVAQIVRQDEQDIIRFTASNGVGLETSAVPGWVDGVLYLCGTNTDDNLKPFAIPRADWRSVRVAVSEYNAQCTTQAPVRVRDWTLDAE